MLTPTQLKPLTKLFDKRQLATAPAELLTYEVDAGFDRGAPDAIFYPETSEDVSSVMQWASAQHVPLVARGAGTGLSGGAVAEYGGMIVVFARMNRILEMDKVGRSAVVEPGMVNLALDAQAKRQGLYFPPDPSSQRSAVLGGNIGENSGGPHCFKYGVTTNYVTGLEVVLADGAIVQMGGRALDYPEYDLCGLLVGSEGTLGIVTKAYIRLIRNPPGVKTLMVSFDSIAQAGKAVSAVIAAGLTPATLEMMDRKVMRMIEDYVAAGLPVEAEAALIVEVDGYPASLDSQMEEVADILTEHGGFDLRFAQSEEARQKIWYGRKSAAGAFSRLSPNFYLVDVTVPRSRLADMLAAVDEVCARHELTVGHVFHAGDGNLHPTLMCDARDEALMRRVFQASDEIIDLCVERQGSITGEHGVGIEKRRYMPIMYTGAELAAMLDIKAIFDPNNLLNPGKVFPNETPSPEFVPAQLPTGSTFAPKDGVEAAAGLHALTLAKQRVQIGGRAIGTPSNADLWLSTQNLSGVRTFAPDDLYITVGAGTRLADVQTFLTERQMQVALASPWADVTIGGVIGANLNAPLRLRYGSIRDNLLAATVALADGRLIQAGRVVVKNVAGYDLPKVFVGAFGTLGLLVDITLKLTPKPRDQRTLVVPVPDLAQGLQWAVTLAPHLLVTAGMVLCPTVQASDAAPYTLVITAEGVSEDVESELDEIRAALQALGVPQGVEGSSSTSTEQWRHFLGNVEADSLCVRVAVPPKDLTFLQQKALVAQAAGARWLYDPANGLAYGCYYHTQMEEVERWLASVRQPAEAMGGYTVVIQAPASVVGNIDLWGYKPSALEMMRKLKAKWDPAEILNPGVFLV